MNRVYGAIDLGGTRIKLGLVQKDRLICQQTLDAENHLGLSPALGKIETEFNTMLAQEDYVLSGIGVGFAGLVDPKTKRIIGSNEKYPDAQSIDLVDWAKTHWGVPLVLDNDARLAALGEWKFGAGKGVSSLVVLTLGTGIGSGVVVNNRVLRGKNNRAGNLGGHIPLGALGNEFPWILHEPYRCTCGNLGCAEALASTWALQRDLGLNPPKGFLAQFPPEELGFKHLFEGVEQNDQECLAIYNQALKVWSALVVAFIHSYDPEMVILTGNILASAPRILPSVQAYIDKYAWTPGQSIPVGVGTLPTSATLWGAGYLASKSSEEVDHEFL